MDCPKCGAPNPENADTCAYCGNKTWDDAPERIRGFNFGAFTLTWLWAFGHRLDGWGTVMLLLYPFQFWLLGRLMASSIFPLFCILGFPLIILKWILSFYLGFSGNSLAWKKNQKVDIDIYIRDQKLWGLGGAIYICVFFWFMPQLVSIPHSPNKAYYSACVEQLKYISSGMEQEISEKGSLKNIHSVEDVCHHILSGYDKPDKCRGKVKERVEEICVPGSLKFKKIDEKKYEIKAKSNERLRCNICVTETAVSPKKYGPEECAATKCVH